MYSQTKLPCFLPGYSVEGRLAPELRPKLQQQQPLLIGLLPHFSVTDESIYVGTAPQFARVGRDWLARQDEAVSAQSLRAKREAVNLSQPSMGKDMLLKRCFTSTETVGLLGTGAQDGHLDFHTAPEFCGQRGTTA